MEKYSSWVRDTGLTRLVQVRRSPAPQLDREQVHGRELRRQRHEGRVRDVAHVDGRERDLGSLDKAAAESM